MENTNIKQIATDLGLGDQQVEKVIELTSEGNTIPFIARYRKELTGNLDEVQIKSIIELDKSLTALSERKAAVLAKIEEQGKLTETLKKAIEDASKLADVEELYLPYKEKRRTKATIAREAGLFLWHVSFCKIKRRLKQKLRALFARALRQRTRLLQERLIF